MRVAMGTDFMTLGMQILGNFRKPLSYPSKQKERGFDIIFIQYLADTDDIREHAGFLPVPGFYRVDFPEGFHTEPVFDIYGDAIKHDYFLDEY
jgi:hypothetical protein